MAHKRELIVGQIQTQLQLILTAGGYHTNAGNNVFVWRVTDIGQDELPAIVIRDKSDSINVQEMDTQDLWTRELSVEIEVVADPSGTSDTTGRQLVSDVYKALGTDTTLNGYAVTIWGDGDEFNVSQDGRQISGAVVNVRVLYQTTIFTES